MKYCISGRQPNSTLREADEIRLNYIDKAKIIDIAMDMPDKTIILMIPKDEPTIDWTYISNCAESISIILCLEDLREVENCEFFGLRWYWRYPIVTYYELQSLAKLKPSYLFLGAPLSFELNKIISYNIPIRLCANVCYDAYIPRENGIQGQWIRPEGQAAYEKYVAALDFIAKDLEHERTLLHIYKDNKSWPGNLNLLLTNFDVNIDNRAVPTELDEVRTTCGQRCMSTGACHYCLSVMKFTTALRDLKARSDDT